MNDDQRSTLVSNKLMILLRKNNPLAVAKIIKFGLAMDEFEVVNDEIDVVAILQSKDITGITDQKDEDQDQLGGFIMDVSGALHSYAHSKKDLDLLAKSNIKKSNIRHKPLTDLMIIAGSLIEEANKIDPVELADQGISAADMTAFTAHYAQLQATGLDNQGAIDDRSAHTKRLDELFEQSRDLRKNTLDRLAVQFQRKDPEFYKKYISASHIIYRQGTPTPEDPEVTPTV